MASKPEDKQVQSQLSRESARAPRGERLKSTVLSIISLTWAQILLALLVGALLSSLVPPEKAYWGPFHHIGIGLLVAAVVTLFWHVREFTYFFERFAKSVLIDDVWLSRLKIGTLTELRSRAGREILQSCVDNRQYERDELANWIDHLLYHRLLPDPKKPSQGAYRADYAETIVIENKILEAVLREIGEDLAHYPREALASPVHKIVTINTYTVISPSTSSPDYRVQLQGRYADMAYFPLASRLLFSVGSSQQDAKEVKVNVTNRELGGIDVNSESVFLKMQGGKCAVWTKTVEFRSPHAEAHILNTMALLTRGMQVDLFQTGGGPDLVFDGGIVATEADDPTFTEHSIHLKFDQWLFENQGYCIWWWERETVAGGDSSHAALK